MYKDLYCTITYYPETSLLYLRWQKQPDLERLLHIYNKGIDLAITVQARCWVADNSAGVNLDVSMQRALTELCARRLKETSIERVARIIPQDVFQELITHKMIYLINQNSVSPFRFELFTCLNEAMEWAVNSGKAQAFA